MVSRRPEHSAVNFLQVPNKEAVCLGEDEPNMHSFFEMRAVFLWSIIDVQCCHIHVKRGLLKTEGTWQERHTSQIRAAAAEH